MSNEEPVSDHNLNDCDFGDDEECLLPCKHGVYGLQYCPLCDQIEHEAILGNGKS